MFLLNSYCTSSASSLSLNFTLIYLLPLYRNHCFSFLLNLAFMVLFSQLVLLLVNLTSLMYDFPNSLTRTYCTVYFNFFLGSPLLCLNLLTMYILFTLYFFVFLSCLLNIYCQNTLSKKVPFPLKYPQALFSINLKLEEVFGNC